MSLGRNWWATLAVIAVGACAWDAMHGGSHAVTFDAACAGFFAWRYAEGVRREIVDAISQCR